MMQWEKNRYKQITLKTVKKQIIATSGLNQNSNFSVSFLLLKIIFWFQQIAHVIKLKESNTYEIKR